MVERGDGVEEEEEARPGSRPRAGAGPGSPRRGAPRRSRGSPTAPAESGGSSGSGTKLLADDEPLERRERSAVARLDASAALEPRLPVSTVSRADGPAAEERVARDRLAALDALEQEALAAARRACGGRAAPASGGPTERRARPARRRPARARARKSPRSAPRVAHAASRRGGSPSTSSSVDVLDAEELAPAARPAPRTSAGPRRSGTSPRAPRGSSRSRGRRAGRRSRRRAAGPRGAAAGIAGGSSSPPADGRRVDVEVRLARRRGPPRPASRRGTPPPARSASASRRAATSDLVAEPARRDDGRARRAARAEDDGAAALARVVVGQRVEDAVHVRVLGAPAPAASRTSVFAAPICADVLGRPRPRAAAASFQGCVTAKPRKGGSNAMLLRRARGRSRRPGAGGRDTAGRARGRARCARSGESDRAVLAADDAEERLDRPRRVDRVDRRGGRRAAIWPARRLALDRTVDERGARRAPRGRGPGALAGPHRERLRRRLALPARLERRRRAGSPARSAAPRDELDRARAGRAHRREPLLPVGRQAEGRVQRDDDALAIRKASPGSASRPLACSTSTVGAGGVRLARRAAGTPRPSRRSRRPRRSVRQVSDGRPRIEREEARRPGSPPRRRSSRNSIAVASRRHARDQALRVRRGRCGASDAT